MTDVTPDPGPAPNEPFRRAVDLASQLARVDPIASVDDLAMDDLTDEEAAAYWSALGYRSDRRHPPTASG